MQAATEIPAQSFDSASLESGAEWTTPSPRRTFLGYTALAALMPLLAVQLISLATRRFPPAVEVLPFLI